MEIGLRLGESLDVAFVEAVEQRTGLGAPIGAESHRPHQTVDRDPRHGLVERALCVARSARQHVSNEIDGVKGERLDELRRMPEMIAIRFEQLA